MGAQCTSLNEVKGGCTSIHLQGHTHEHHRRHERSQPTKPPLRCGLRRRPMLRVLLMEVIVSASGKVMRRSANLRGILDFSRIHIIEQIGIRRMEDGTGMLYMRWDIGPSGHATAITEFADYSILKDWVRTRLNFQGAPLTVNDRSGYTVSRDAAVLQP